MDSPSREHELRMEQWASAGWHEPDEEIKRLHERETALGQIPPEAALIRQVMSGLQICHYRWERHVDNLIRSIAAGALVSEWGSAEPAAEDRERVEHLRGYHSAVKAWYSGKSAEEALKESPESADLIERVYESLGAPTEAKKALVRIMLTSAEGRAAEKMLEQGRWPTAPDAPPAAAGETKTVGQYIALHLTQEGFFPNPCHISFFENYEALLESIGEGDTVDWFKGCGIQGPPPEMTAKAEDYVAGLVAWLQGADQPPSGAGEKARFVLDTLGSADRDPLRVWLTGCLLKSICGHLGKPVAECAGGQIPF